MTWIKICGMTNLEDALVAVDAGADAVGFVFYEKSPRYVSVETAREICSKLPDAVEKVGVFVSGGSVNPSNVFLETGLTGIQSYFFPQEPSVARQGGTGIDIDLLPKNARMMMALPMNLIAHEETQTRDFNFDFGDWGENVPSRPREIVSHIVLDSGDLKQPGGTGKSFDWARAIPIANTMKRKHIKMVVAGGLTSENVIQAIDILHPWGVDVVSGVEASPGKKDAGKVRAFVRAVREINRKAS